MTWPFYLMALVAIIATVRVITNANPVHALLSLIVSLLAVAGIFFTVGSAFAGVLEIIVYAGAIMVLFVFVVMMLNLGSHTVGQEKVWLTSETWAWPSALSFILAIILLWQIAQADSNRLIGIEHIPVKAVGIKLYTQYVLLVEVAAMLLLGAIVAAYHLGKRGLGDDEEERN